MARSRSRTEDSGYVKVNALFDVVNYHDGDSIHSHEKATMGPVITLPKEELQRLEVLGAVEKVSAKEAKAAEEAQAHQEEHPEGGQDPDALAPGGENSEEAAKASDDDDSSK